MTNKDMAILEKVGRIEQDLQRLKVDLILGGKIRRDEEGIYNEEEIMREVRRVRKGLYNEKRGAKKEM